MDLVFHIQTDLVETEAAFSGHFKKFS